MSSSDLKFNCIGFLEYVTFIMLNRWNNHCKLFRTESASKSHTYGNHTIWQGNYVITCILSFRIVIEYIWYISTNRKVFSMSQLVCNMNLEIILIFHHSVCISMFIFCIYGNNNNNKKSKERVRCSTKLSSAIFQ